MKIDIDSEGIFTGKELAMALLEALIENSKILADVRTELRLVHSETDNIRTVHTKEMRDMKRRVSSLEDVLHLEARV